MSFTNQRLFTSQAQDDHGLDPAALTVQLIGEGKRVLDLGPEDESIARMLQHNKCHIVAVEKDRTACNALRRYCTDVIHGDVQQLHLGQRLRWRKFDVLLLGSLLQQVADPVAMLRKVMPFLSPQGSLVASIFNIGHASCRLSLLAGDFAYRESGIRGQDQLRFFTLASIDRTFAQAGLAVESVERVIVDPFEEPFADLPGWDASSVPEAIKLLLERDPEARVAKYVVQAAPISEELQRQHLLEREQPAAQEPRMLMTAEAREALDRPTLAAREAHRRAEARTHELESELSQAGQMAAARAEQLGELCQQLEQARHSAQRTVRDAELRSAELETQLQARDEELRRRDTLIEQRDDALARQAAALTQRTEALQSKDALLAEQLESLTHKDALLAERDEALRERDARLDGAAAELESREEALCAKAQHALELQARLDEKAGAVAGLEQQVDGLAQQLAEREGNLSRRQGQVELLEGQIAERDAALGELTRQIEDLGQQIARRDATLGELQHQIEDLGQQLAAREATLGDQQQRIEDLERQLMADQANLGDSQRRIEELERQLAERDSWLGERHQRINGLEQQLAQREQELAEHQAEIPRHEQQLAERQAEVAQREQELADQQAEIARLELELQQRDGNLGEKSSQLTQLEAERAEREQVIAQQAERLTQLRDSLESIKAGTKQAYRTWNDRAAEIQQALEAEREAVAQRDEQIDSLRRAVAEARAEATRIAELDADLQARDALIENQRASLAELAEQLAHDSPDPQASGKLRSQVEALEAELELSLHQVEDREREVGAFRERLEQVKRNAEQVQVGLQIRAAELEQQLHDVRSSVAWKVLERAEQTKQLLLPAGSRRRKVFDRLLSKGPQLGRAGLDGSRPHGAVGASEPAAPQSHLPVPRRFNAAAYRVGGWFARFRRSDQDAYV